MKKIIILICLLMVGGCDVYEKLYGVEPTEVELTLEGFHLECYEEKVVPISYLCEHYEQGKLVIMREYRFDEKGIYSETWEKNLHIKYNEYFYGDFHSEYMDCSGDNAGKIGCLIELVNFYSEPLDCIIENTTICTKEILVRDVE